MGRCLIFTVKLEKEEKIEYRIIYIQHDSTSVLKIMFRHALKSLKGNTLDINMLSLWDRISRGLSHLYIVGIFFSSENVL